MTPLFLALLGSLALGVTTDLQKDKAPRCYELRTYTAAPGKLEELHARFRNHTTKLFKKHGIANIGYWTPIENPDNKLIYIVAFPSREAREAMWKAFGDDPEWKAAYQESEKNGTLVTKVESVLLQTTDYSPNLRASSSKEPRTFELRTYKTVAGKLDDLNARFRNHTTKLFKKHAITNIGYWTPMDASQGANDTLIYIVSHKSQESAKQSWEAFRSDPNWIAARDASEKNGKILEKAPDALFLQPTDYSPLK